MIIKIIRGKTQPWNCYNREKKLYQVSRYSHTLLNVQGVVAVGSTVGSNYTVGGKTSEDQGSRNYKKLQKMIKKCTKTQCENTGSVNCRLLHTISMVAVLHIYVTNSSKT